MSSEDGKKFSFIWKIKNFSHSDRVNGESITSPTFVAESDGGSKWSVQIYPKGYDKENDEFIACFLKRESDGLCGSFSEELVIDFSLDVNGENGETIGSYQEKNKVFKKGDSFGCLKLVKVENVENKILSWHEDILIIRCCLISYKPISSEYIAMTTIPVGLCSFYWKVSTNKCQGKDVVANQKKLEIITKSNDSYFSVNMKYAYTNGYYWRVTSDITLFNMNGTSILQKRDVHNIPYSCGSSHLWEILRLTKEQLSDSKYAVDNRKELILACKFYISNESNFDEIVTCKSEPSSPLATLQKELQTLLLDEKHADVKLRTNNQVISAHRSLLVTRSPVFSVMFDQEMIESKTGIIEVPDVDPETLKRFLEFLYTGAIRDFEYDSASKLLIVADKYQVSSLYELCSSYLVSHLTVANVREVICLADMTNHESLKTSGMNFVANHAAAVMGSSDWKEWMEKNQNLSAEIISNILTNFSIVPKHICEK